MKRFNDSRITLLLPALVLMFAGGSAKADFTFGSFAKLEFSGPDTILCFSYDGLEMYISAERPEGYGGGDLWVCKRTSQDENWGPAENLGQAVNSPSQEYSASISADGLTLYFESDRPGGSGWDIYMTTRATKEDPWGKAVALPSVINTISAGEPWISPDGLELYFNGYGHGGSGNSDIWVTRRATEKDPWGAPVNLGPTVNGIYDDHYLSLSPDGLLLFFCEYFSWEGPFRPDAYGLGDIWMTRRASLSAPWQVPVNLGAQINSSGWDLLPRVSPDGRTLYFWNELAGNNGYWLAPIMPICDFSADGIVDAADVRIMIDHWGQNYPLCDIGPFAWGDGTVDVQDLIVLTEHLPRGDDAEPSASRRKLKVLFIGNSYTSRIQSTLDDAVRASPYFESAFEYIAPGAWTLQQHLNSENTMSRIRGQPWDFVVLQEQSRLPTLPDRCGEFYDAVAKLSEAIKESGGQVVLYMTWGRRDYDPQSPEINPDYETMQQRLIEAYTTAARSIDAIIAPVGLAWQRVRRNNPELGRQLYDDDGTHPSLRGAFLVASVFYATLFNTDPTQLGYNDSLTPGEAEYLKGKAKEAFISNVDFNGDETVEINDLIILIERWGTNDTLCDIAPMFRGDGIVDENDLKVLMSYWQQEVLPVNLSACWKLDETEGMIAHDSAATNDAYVLGGAVWQPAGGQVGGALQLDGVDDCITAPAVLNPANGVFSVLAWVKGGASGQVVISEPTGANWLMADAEGKLMTELKGPGRDGAPLQSQTIITDGQWHRVGLVWDGSRRMLYVDSVVAAEDTQSALPGSGNGLYIGAGKKMEPGTFWSGLIDDIRIYNRAVKP